jgi:hypothetical protein
MRLTIGSMVRLRLANIHGTSDFLLEEEVGGARYARYYLLLRDSSKWSARPGLRYQVAPGRNGSFHSKRDRVSAQNEKSCDLQCWRCDLLTM